jgi:serine/threonine protein kinase
MLSHLQHMRIPRLRDHSTSGSAWFLALDYIAGETLEGYLKRQSALLSVHEVLDIGIQLCEVLEYLHSQHPPIKFRDLKPANIMRQPNGQLMLIDFGLALPFQPGRLDAVTLGTPGYAAPEQYANRYGQGATALQSDIYSLGVILHQLFSGEHPAKKPLSALFVFSALANKILPELAALVGEMLQREPGQRTRSIQEVKRLLEEVQTTSFCSAEQKGVVIPIPA